MSKGNEAGDAPTGAATIRDLKQQLAELQEFKQELHATLLKLHAKDEFVARR
jgi:hypothetical protein